MLPYITETQAVKLFKELLKEGDSPSAPFNPSELLNKVVTLDLGVVEHKAWLEDNQYQVNIDAEIIEKMIELNASEVVVPFKLTCDNKEYIIIYYEAASEEMISSLIDIYPDHANGEEHHTFNNLAYRADTEDPIVVLTKEQPLE